MSSTLKVAVAFGLLVGAAPSGVGAKDLNTQLMNATFKVSNPKSTATVFLLSRPAPEDATKNQYILVTANHVFENMLGEEAVVFFRQKESEGVYKKVPLKLPIRKMGKPLWVKHPSVDVAVMTIVPPDKTDIPRLPLDLLASDETLKKNAVHPGDELRCLGYPHMMEANPAGFPILRSGAVASYPLVPARTTKTFLMNYNAFEGDSGGPVYLTQANRFLEGTSQPVKVRLIIGLVMAQHFIDMETRTVYETRKVRHRMGLAIIIHATYIRETIDRLPQAPKK